MLTERDLSAGTEASKRWKRRRTISLHSSRQSTPKLNTPHRPPVTKCETEPIRKKKNMEAYQKYAEIIAQQNSQAPPSEFRPTYQTDLSKRGLIVKASLGSGSYSKVKKAIDIKANPSNEVAVKIIDRFKTPKDYQIKFLPRELKIWSRLRHSNLIALLDFFEENARVYMVLEYAPDGDALKYVQEVGALSDDTARCWMTQILSAVHYMHNNSVAHRDLKLENLLLTNKAKTIKLSDFGFVKGVTRSELSQTFCGSKAYAAPEILKGRSYDPKKGDIWALGVILYIIVTGKMPFDETRGTSHIIEEQAKLKLHWNKSALGSKQLPSQHLILRMFTWDFKLRPDINSICKDSWLAQPASS